MKIRKLAAVVCIALSSCVSVKPPEILGVKVSLMSQYSKHVKISGAVQGVGYRAWTQKEALALGVNGWVKNLSDGSVEALLQGAKEKVDHLLKKLESGPNLSRVKHVEVMGEACQDMYSDFKIMR